MRGDGRAHLASRHSLVLMVARALVAVEVVVGSEEECGLVVGIALVFGALKETVQVAGIDSGKDRWDRTKVAPFQHHKHRPAEERRERGSGDSFELIVIGF